MKITVVLSTAEGFFASREHKGPNLKALLAHVVPMLESMPDEVDGAKQYNWTKLHIEVSQ